MRRVGDLLFLACLAFLPGCHSIPFQPGVLDGALDEVNDPLLHHATKALEANDHELACHWLRQYVARHPESKTVPAFYAEVLYKLARYSEARRNFEKAIAGLQDDTTPDTSYLVHCHGRLLELAGIDADDYAEHLHRGIGLYLLATERKPDDEMTEEAILCKAALELSEAHTRSPGEARPCWYLYLVWQRLGRSQPAQRWLRDADTLAPLSYLTPRERQDLATRWAGTK